MSSYDDAEEPIERHWGRFGFLIADLFTALAILFLVANTVGNVTFPPPNTGPGGNGPPIICGLDPTLTRLIVNLADPGGLLSGASGAEQMFANDMRRTLKHYSGQIAGLVEVSGEGQGDYQQSIGDGQTIADNAVRGLKILGRQKYIFTLDKTIYQSDWDGTGDIAYGQIKLILFFYTLSNTSCTV